MKRFVSSALALLAIIAFAARPASAQVINGGFESGDFTGWFNELNNTGFDGVDAFSAHSGSFGAFFGEVGSTSTLRQEVGTTAGQGYTLSFWLSNDGNTPSFFDVSWNGSSLFSLTNPAGFAYGLNSFNVVGAAGGSTTLLFTFQQDPAFFRLDDVTLDAVGVDPNSVVPEPATMSLLATGLAGMAGAGMRRRRKKA
jgi:hypothetical protein